MKQWEPNPKEIPPFENNGTECRGENSCLPTELAHMCLGNDFLKRYIEYERENSDYFSRVWEDMSEYLSVGLRQKIDLSCLTYFTIGLENKLFRPQRGCWIRYSQVAFSQYEIRNGLKCSFLFFFFLN